MRFEFLERVTRCSDKDDGPLKHGWPNGDAPARIARSFTLQRVGPIVNSVDLMFSYVVEREFSSGIKINEYMALSNCLK